MTAHTEQNEKTHTDILSVPLRHKGSDVIKYYDYWEWGWMIVLSKIPFVECKFIRLWTRDNVIIISIIREIYDDMESVDVTILRNAV